MFRHHLWGQSQLFFFCKTRFYVRLRNVTHPRSPRAYDSLEPGALSRTAVQPALVFYVRTAVVKVHTYVYTVTMPPLPSRRHRKPVQLPLSLPLSPLQRRMTRISYTSYKNTHDAHTTTYKNKHDAHANNITTPVLQKVGAVKTYKPGTMARV